ncbi:extracellular solute-binding protein [Notoacmeibacter sp. MSK16QG-6]|uniref:extracellular solute-binding protein n=1 Tax=Notoacmeibacter sp. MSK16QG-6 TaxID=2957982 RepID=UPI0035309235
MIKLHRMRKLFPVSTTAWTGISMAAAICVTLVSSPVFAEPSHAIAMHGEPALPADFDHFPYANPDAPKGGKVTYGLPGTFNSVNPFIIQGDGVRGLNDLEVGMNVFEPLMARSYDEPFTLYPLIAESVETDAERSFVEFQIDPRAAFSDGKPVRPEDVMFTFDLLAEKANPRYKRLRDKISKMERAGERGVRFTLDPELRDRELPLIIAMMPVLPEHAIDPENFDKSTLEPIIGTGPYTLSEVRPGERVTLTRNPDYWGKDIPSKKGFDNYDQIQIVYYRDQTARFESFKKGEIDIQIEQSPFANSDPARWAKRYDFPRAISGDVKKSTFESALPSGMRGIVFNTRRPPFDDPKVRRAIVNLFDFDWINRNIFDNAYVRIGSYFDNSVLNSQEAPASEAEKALLAPYSDQLLPEILAGQWTPPSSDGTGRDRDFVRNALSLFEDAGYKLEGRQLVGPTGEPLSFELMIDGSDGEMIALSWQKTLALLGIRLNLRKVDTAQYFERRKRFDYDALIHFYSSSLSPGAEQIGRWSSVAADAEGSFNFAGAKDPAVDAMIDAMLAAKTQEEFRAAVHAYDRVLLSGFYVVPFYFMSEQRVAHDADLAYPQKTALYGFQLPTWWRQSAAKQ